MSTNGSVVLGSVSIQTQVASQVQREDLRPKAIPETAPSTTPPIRHCTALVAVMGKTPNAPSPLTGTTKTDSDSNIERKF